MLYYQKLNYHQDFHYHLAAVIAATAVGPQVGVKGELGPLLVKVVAEALKPPAPPPPPESPGPLADPDPPPATTK